MDAYETKADGDGGENGRKVSASGMHGCQAGASLDDVVKRTGMG